MEFVNVDMPRGPVVKVKAALQSGEGSNPEIRRFSLNVSDTPDAFDALMTAVRSVYSIKSGDNCRLFWKDEDDDMVQFSTSDELRHALDSTRDDTLRIYITITPNNMECGDVDDMENVSTAPPMAPFDGIPPSQHFPPYPEAQPHPHPHPHHPHHHPHHPHHHPHHPMHHGMWAGAGAMGFSCGKKGKKIAKKIWKIQKKINKAGNKEFMNLRQQVPEEFRAWVREYVRTWFAQDGSNPVEVSCKFPSSLNLDVQVFGQWLHVFLGHWSEGSAAAAEMTEELGEKMHEDAQEDGEFLSAPEGLPALYYRWICLFIQRFAVRYFSAVDAEASVAAGHAAFGFGGWHGKHGWGKCKKGKCGKGNGHKRLSASSSSSSSESDSDTDGVNRTPCQVPKAFRKFVRASTKHLHKNKVNKFFKAQGKATLAGLSQEVMEFVNQVLLEWHVKLAQKRPQAVATEMMSAERTLPQGIEKDHFLWLCRFVARWHHKHAAKCEAMADWSSGSSSDDMSGEDAGDACRFAAWGPWAHGHRHHMKAACRAMRSGPYFGQPVFGGMGPWGRMRSHFGGMGPGCGGVGPSSAQSPQIGRMGAHFGWMGPFGGMGPHGFMGCPPPPPPPAYGMPFYPTNSPGNQQGQSPSASGPAAGSKSADAMEQVTQGVKKL